MKKNKIIWIIVAIVILGLVIFLITRKERPFNQLDIPITNSVKNQTELEYVVPIINAGLYQLKIDSTYIMVKPMSLIMKTNGLGDKDYDLMGSLLGNRNQFMMYLDNINRYDGMDIIAHELIHLDQYHSGRLVKREGFNSVLWEGKIYDVTTIPYKERPWEIEAFNRDKDLRKKIYDMLLK